MRSCFTMMAGASAGTGTIRSHGSPNNPGATAGSRLTAHRPGDHADDDGAGQPRFAQGPMDAGRFSRHVFAGGLPGGRWRKSLIEWWLKSQKFDEQLLDTFLKHPQFDSWAETDANTQMSFFFFFLLG